ncbi:hypothetical protein [Roseateles sp. P5_E11]
MKMAATCCAAMITTSSSAGALLGLGWKPWTSPGADDVAVRPKAFVRPPENTYELEANLRSIAVGPYQRGRSTDEHPAGAVVGSYSNSASEVVRAYIWEGGGGFWAVAVIGGMVVWFNDIEDGFNRSRYTSFGKIDEYLCNQDELEIAIQQVCNMLETGVDSASRCGPPRAGEYLPGAQSIPL